METIERFAPLGGRILLSFIFLMSGVGKIANLAGTAGYMAAKGMPWIPFFLFMAIVFELVGGLSVLTGYKARFGALMLLVFLILATVIFHNFWAVEEAQRMMQTTNFLKNTAIMGGLMLIIGMGPGPLSLKCRSKDAAAAPQ